MGSVPVDPRAEAVNAVLELVRLAGPVVDAATLPPEEVAHAVAEQRAMVIHIASCMGTRDITVSTQLSPARHPIWSSRGQCPRTSARSANRYGT